MKRNSLSRKNYQGNNNNTSIIARKIIAFYFVIFVIISLVIIIAYFMLQWTSTNNDKENDNSIKVIIDTDGGVDDAMAIMILLSKNHKHPLNVLAITVVDGNTGLENATENVLITLNQMQRNDIAVHMGASHGIITNRVGGYFYGYDGFGNYNERDIPTHTIPRDGVYKIIEMVKKYPGQVSLLCIGPLTNIALAIRLYPQLLSQVKNIYIMGGSINGTREFNVECDAEAARIVYENAIGNKTVVLPCDAIHNIDISLDWRRNVLGVIKSRQMEFLNRVEGVAMKTFEQEGWIWPEADPVLALMFIEREKLGNVKNVSSRAVKSGIAVSTCPDSLRGYTTLIRNNDIEFTTLVNATAVKNSYLSYFQ